MKPLIPRIQFAGESGHLDTPMSTSPVATAVRNSQDSQTPRTKPNEAITSTSAP